MALKVIKCAETFALRSHYLRIQKSAKIAAATIACLAVVVTYSVLRAQEAVATSHSVWDGVYTKAQADRGHSLYDQSCAQCHGLLLDGGDQTPPLTGEQFLSNWNGQTVGSLFDRIHNTMPQDNPGTLSPDANADILAYILSNSSFPAGTTELAHQADVLAQIRIDSTKPDTKSK